MAAPWAFAADTPLDETKTRIALPMDEAPIIDGVINDDEWAQSGNAGWEFRIVEDDGDDGIKGADLRNGDKPDDDTDLSANLYAGVVGENLYIGVKVTDDDISTDTASAGSENEMTWQDDSVEIFIDGDNSNFGSRDTTGENPEVVDSGGQYVITANSAYRHAEAGNPRFDPSSGWFAETKENEAGDGYHAEFRIPLSEIGNPQPGEHIGFTVAINDDDGGGNTDSVLIWTGLDHVEETFGNLVVGHRRYEGLKAAPPTIDGKIEDGEYPGADIVSINPFTGVFRVGDDQPRADDISFDWRVTHNEDAIYVAVRVTDDVLFNDGAEAGEENGNTWNDDSVEIFFDSNESNLSGRDQEEMFDGQFVMTANGAWRHNEANNPTYGPDEHWWAQTSIAEDGKSWDVEFIIKKSTLVGGDREDVPMGFNVNINDDDDGGNRETQLNWDGNPHTESSYGELVLLSAIPSDPNAVADRSVRFGLLDQSDGARTETLKIRNAGDAQTLTLSDAAITGPDESVFTLGDFPTSLAPGEEGLATITFDAGGAKGSYEATLSYKTNDPNPSEADLTASLSASVANLAGPISRYSLDDMDGTMLDVSGFGRSGTYVDATVGQEALISGGASVLFSGGGYGQVPGDVFDSFIRFSVAAWVNLNDLSDQQTIFAKGTPDGAPTFALLSSGGNLEWFSNGESEFATDGAVLTAGTTHHVVVTWSTNKAVLYVDGVAVAEQDAPSEIEIVQENPFLVGAFHGGLKMEGRMDDVQFYNRAITGDTVAAMFAEPGCELTNQGCVGDDEDPKGIVSQWSFENNLDDSGAASSTADALTATGAAAYAAGVVGQAVNITADGLQRLRAEDSDDLELGENWTLEAFVWPDANNTGEWDRFWTKWGDGGEQWHTSFRSTGTVDVENGLDLFINGGDNIINSNTTAEVPLEQWSHVAFVGDSAENTITAWLNGVEVGSTAYQSVTPGDGAMNFGNFQSPANGLQYTGLIDEAAIHNVAVSPDYLASQAALIPPVGGGITWGEVDLDTTVDDLIGGPTLTFTPFAYDGGNAEGTFWTGDGGTTGDDILDSIYNSHGWNGDGASITLDGLTAGESYQVQLLGAGDTRGCCNTRNQAASDGTNVSGDFPRGNSSVIGTFTAAGASQEIMIISGTDNGVDPGLSAFILTDAAGGFISASNVGRTEGDDIVLSVAVDGIPALVDLDASGLSAGAAGAWTNAGSLGGDFQPFGDPTVEVIDGVTGVTLDGDGDYFEGPVSTPEIEGSSPRSIIAWVYNPQLASEETVISWGKRGGPDGTNMSFNHGFHNNFGAVGHWGGGGPDIGWNPNSDVEDEEPNVPGDAMAGTWTHISYTQTGAFTKVFTNGQLSNSEDAALDTFGGLGILVGAQREGNGVDVTDPLKGSLSIGRVRIFDSTLSDEDILADFVASAADFGVPVDFEDVAGVIGYWRFDEGAGGTVADSSGHGNHGTVVAPEAAWVTDDTLGSVYQSGGGSYVDLGTLPTISLDTDFTWSFWVNAGETDNNNIVFGNRYMPDGMDFAPREFVKFTPRVFEWHVDGGGQNVPGDNTMFVVGEWSHRLVVKSGNNLTYYINGAEVASSDVTSAPANAQPLYLGGQPGADGAAVENFNGLFDEVAVFNRALSAEDVTEVYNRGLAGQPLTSGGGGGDPLPDLTAVGFGADGAFSVTLPDGVTADIEYSTDLINWEVIAPAASGTVTETDAGRQAAPAGFYRGKQ
ncbi:MAG: hypothetical protein GWQ05_23525 [Verrucomicrobiaceae bacterium]|nr:hypothetical protein [Verrucomicrobiaceae bacterium]